jgi:hypothetical protein
MPGVDGRIIMNGGEEAVNFGLICGLPEKN